MQHDLEPSIVDMFINDNKSVEQIADILDLSYEEVFAVLDQAELV